MSCKLLPEEPSANTLQVNGQVSFLVYLRCGCIKYGIVHLRYRFLDRSSNNVCILFSSSQTTVSENNLRTEYECTKFSKLFK